MMHLKHTFVHRIALSKTVRRRRDRYVTISNSNHVETDNLGYIELTDTIRAGKGWSVLVTEIEDKDFGLMIDHMMRAHPEATIRAIGATLAKFRHTNEPRQ